MSPTSMLADCEAEKERSVRQLAARVPDGPPVVPHPTLLANYEPKVARRREAYKDETVRTEAIAALRGLVESVTVHVAADGARTLEVEASTATLIDFAQRTNAPRRVAGGRSIAMVAGTGFEPVTFRL